MFSQYKALIQETKDKPKRKKSTLKYFVIKSSSNKQKKVK
jgi:hypothetical protein